MLVKISPYSAAFRAEAGGLYSGHGTNTGAKDGIDDATGGGAAGLPARGAAFVRRPVLSPPGRRRSLDLGTERRRKNQPAAHSGGAPGPRRGALRLVARFCNPGAGARTRSAFGTIDFRRRGGRRQ